MIRPVPSWMLLWVLAIDAWIVAANMGGGAVVFKPLESDMHRSAGPKGSFCNCTITTFMRDPQCKGIGATSKLEAGYGVCSGGNITQPGNDEIYDPAHEFSIKLSLDCTEILWWNNSSDCHGPRASRYSANANACLNVMDLAGFKLKCSRALHAAATPKVDLCTCTTKKFANPDCSGELKATLTSVIPKLCTPDSVEHAHPGYAQKMSHDCKHVTVYSDSACTQQVLTVKTGKCEAGELISCGGANKLHPSSSLLLSLLAVPALILYHLL